MITAKAHTDVRRYANVMVKAQDLNGKPFVIEAKDGTLLARALQHEFDHLDGILFIDHSRNIFDTITVLEKNGLPSIEQDKILDEPELEEMINSTKEEN